MLERIKIHRQYFPKFLYEHGCFFVFFFFPSFLIRQITVVFEIGILWNNKMNIRII